MVIQPNLPQAVYEVLARLNSAGYEAYLVGGSVRDICMNRTPHDFDITTSAYPEQTRACFPDCPVIDTGIQHGTVTVLWKKQPFEITTYRVDGAYQDHRHPTEVTFTASLRADLARRDFTVNAMAWHPQNGLQDPFDGQSDLAAKCIRCVGVPDKRFREDGLRILRAVRFASVLDFSIEPQTAQAVHRNRVLLQAISAERIAVEWKKTLCGIRAQSVLQEYADIFTVFLPEFPRDERVLSVFSQIDKDNIARIAAFFYPSDAQTVQKALQRLKFDRETVKSATELTAMLQAPMPTNPTDIRRETGRIGYAAMLRFLRLRAWLQPEAQDACQAATAVVARAQETNACLTVGQLAVSGTELKQIGIVPGKEMGEVLRRLLQAVLAEECANTKEALLERAKQCLKNPRHERF